MKKLYRALGAVGAIIVILILLCGAGEHSVSNFYIVPAGIFSPVHEVNPQPDQTLADNPAKMHSIPEMTETETHPVPEERVIASFAQDQIDPAEQVSADNLSSIQMLLKATEEDINPYLYPDGPVIGYGRDMHGSIIVMMDESQVANQTVVDEIYQRISAKGKMYHIDRVPCRFIAMGIMKIDLAKDTVS